MRGRTVKIGLFLLLIVAAFAAAYGSADIPLSNVVRILLSTLGVGDVSDLPQNDINIILDLRSPRVVLLTLVGGALAISGAALQAIFQNPMADPGVLGVTGGGAFGAVLSIYLGFTDVVPLALPFFALAGALASSFLVYLLAHIGGRPTTTTLLLTGIAIGTLTAAGMGFLLAGTDEYRVKQVFFWLIGGAEARTWNHVLLATPFIFIGTSILLFASRPIDILSLGEDHALSVGVAVGPMRMLLLFACAVAASAAVSACGSIAFVGLIIPHAIRYLVGARSRTLLPACFLGGGAFLVLCDLAARVAPFKTELHLGVLTAFLGVPFLLFLMIRAKRISN
ncbi:MAG: FecCD family ABC transporter permease [Planctomycetota bacterium]